MSLIILVCLSFRMLFLLPSDVTIKRLMELCLKYERCVLDNQDIFWALTFFFWRTNNSFRTYTCWNLFWWICEFRAAQKHFLMKQSAVFNRDSIQMKMVSKMAHVYCKRLKLLTHYNKKLLLWITYDLQDMLCNLHVYTELRETDVAEYNRNMLEGNMAYSSMLVITFWNSHNTLMQSYPCQLYIYILLLWFMKEMLYSKFTFHIRIIIFKYFSYTKLICCTSQWLFQFEGYLWRIYIFLNEIYYTFSKC